MTSGCYKIVMTKFSTVSGGILNTITPFYFRFNKLKIPHPISGVYLVETKLPQYNTHQTPRITVAGSLCRCHSCDKLASVAFGMCYIKAVESRQAFLNFKIFLRKNFEYPVGVLMIFYAF